jgi:hypothetical protein
VNVFFFSHTKISGLDPPLLSICVFIVSVCSIVALYFLDASVNLLLCWMSLFRIFVFGFRLIWSSMQNIYKKYCLWLCLYPRRLGLHPHPSYLTTTLRLQSNSSPLFYFRSLVSWFLKRHNFIRVYNFPQRWYLLIMF